MPQYSDYHLFKLIKLITKCVSESTQLLEKACHKSIPTSKTKLKKGKNAEVVDINFRAKTQKTKADRSKGSLPLT